MMPEEGQVLIDPQFSEPGGKRQSGSRSNRRSGVGVRPGSKVWGRPATSLKVSVAAEPASARKRAIVSGTTRCSCARARRSISGRPGISRWLYY